MQEIVNIIGIAVCVTAMVGMLVLAGRWAWHKIPHHARRESDVLQRLSEIVVALNAQNEVLRKPNTELGVQTSLLLEIRNAAKDRVELCRRLAETDPTLDALRQINEHLIADVASRAQMDEVLDVLKEIRDASSVGAVELEKVAGAAEWARGGVSGVADKLDKLQAFLQKQDAMKILAMDTLVMDFAKFSKSQHQFVNSLFNGGSISTVGDEEAAEMERINDLMRRYGISREAATERVKGSSVYQSSTGRGRMGDSV